MTENAPSAEPDPQQLHLSDESEKEDAEYEKEEYEEEENCRGRPDTKCDAYNAIFPFNELTIATKSGLTKLVR